MRVCVCVCVPVCVCVWVCVNVCARVPVGSVHPGEALRDVLLHVALLVLLLLQVGVQLADAVQQRLHASLRAAQHRYKRKLYTTTYFLLSFYNT